MWPVRFGQYISAIQQLIKRLSLVMFITAALFSYTTISVCLSQMWRRSCTWRAWSYNHCGCCGDGPSADHPSWNTQPRSWWTLSQIWCPPVQRRFYYHRVTEKRWPKHSTSGKLNHNGKDSSPKSILLSWMLSHAASKNWISWWQYRVKLTFIMEPSIDNEKQCNVIIFQIFNFAAD